MMMKKCLAFSLGLFALLMLPSASLAEPQPAPSTEQLQAAIFAPAAQADVDPADLPELGIPEWLNANHCNPDRPCANHICECNHTCASTGVRSVTCGPTWTCFCN